MFDLDERREETTPLPPITTSDTIFDSTTVLPVTGIPVKTEVRIARVTVLVS